MIKTWAEPVAFQKSAFLPTIKFVSTSKIFCFPFAQMKNE
jgi:hypothetical protein